MKFKSTPLTVINNLLLMSFLYMEDDSNTIHSNNTFVYKNYICGCYHILNNIQL